MRRLMIGLLVFGMMAVNAFGADYLHGQTAAAVTVTTDFTDIIEVSGSPADYGAITFELTNAGAVALSDIQILAKAHPSGAWFTYLSTVPSYVTANPETLAGSGISRFTISCGHYYGFKLQAKVAATTTTATCRVLVTPKGSDIWSQLLYGNMTASGAGIYVRQDSTGTIAKETGGNLATVKTNTDTLVTAGGGGYVRQDSTATIAKETGGNLATVKTNTDPLVTAAGGGYVRQDSTATIAKESGGNLADAATALKQITGNGLTFTRVKIDQTAAAGATALIGALASNYSRVHVIFGTMEAAGTLTIEDSDGTDISGPMPVGANGGFVINLGTDKTLCPVTAVGKGISINTTQKFYGWALVSQGTN